MGHAGAIFLEDNGQARSFVEEAQIGGQLQHPGVVPIYELGTFGEGRPYFTMKLVKGQTLGELLAERESPAVDLPRFLNIFHQMCQTMAYAHARDVIHRDLKPSNVMVGSFGEVQVMDWGLAKVLPRGGVVDDAGPRPAPRIRRSSPRALAHGRFAITATCRMRKSRRGSAASFDWSSLNWTNGDEGSGQPQRPSS